MSFRSRVVPAVLLIAAAVPATAAVPDRITGAINTNDRATLHGSLKPVPPSAVDQGTLPPEQTIRGVRLILDPTPDQASALGQLLEAQRNPSSPDFQRWLTPEEFGDRFGASANDLARISSWLAAEGLHVDEVARAQNRISVSGSAQVISRVFQTELHAYEVNGSRHFAAVREPSVPAALARAITSIRGLDDFHPRPLHVVAGSPEYTATTGTHYLAPGDFAAIYDLGPLYSAGYTGALEKLAIVGQTDISLTDIRAFRAQFGLQALDPQIVLTGADPGTSQGDQVEAELDVEWSGAVARNATVIYVNSLDVFESLEYAIDQNLAPVVSMSYGTCEAEGSGSYRSLAQQANAEGITWTNASGDSGAAGCDYDASSAQHGPSVIFPADIPEVTAVGGTEFNETGSTGWSTSNGATLTSATGYLPEKSWNDTALGHGLEASGGGLSALFTKPWWQTGPGVPSDGVRDVPDIALTASALHDPYMIYVGGALMEVGGTSCASPAFAGILTLLNQYLVAKGVRTKPGLGNINPNLYQLAQSSSAASAFHDISSGNNVVPCVSGSAGCKSGSFGYTAGAGYDPVTGLGSVDAYNFVTKWSAAAAAVGTTTALSGSPASFAAGASTQLTATVSAVSGSAAPTGSVAFTAGSVTLGTAALTASSAAAKSSAVLTVKGTALATGNNAVSATYVPTGNFAASSGAVTLSVTSSAVATTMTLSASPATVASTATTQLTALVKPVTGTKSPTGTVTVSLGNTVLGSATLTASGANGTATITVKAVSLAVGSNTIAASFAPSGSFSASSATTAITVTSPLTATVTTVTAAASSIASSASTTLTVKVKGSTGTAVPTGTVTFSAGTTALGTATLSAGSASFTLKGASLAAGANTISVSYTGASAFSPSSATVTVTVTGSTSSTAAAITLTATKTTSRQAGFPVNFQLTETAGVAATITGFTINGTDFSTVIAPAFGSAKLPAHGSLASTLIIQWSPLPSTLTFVLSGTDANGHTWSKTAALSTGVAVSSTK